MRNGKNDDVKAALETRSSLRFGSARALTGWGLTAAFAGLLGVASFTSYAKAPTRGVPAGAKPASDVLPAIAGLSAQDSGALASRFDKEVWPIMAEDCVPCHGQKNASQFLLAPDSRSAFLKMLGEGLLDPDNHTGIIERVSTVDKNVLMPPPSFGKLTRAQVATLTKFTEDLQTARKSVKGGAPDEAFPAQLELPYSGKRLSEGMDNTFLTYGQLRGKIKTIFGDDWVRGDRDLFVENVSLFDGADFIKRFDESAKATPTYFTGLDMMSRDVASKAFLARTGPFAGLPMGLPSPLGMKAPSPAYTAAIDHLYERMLFRDPNPTEMKQAFGFLQTVYRSQGSLSKSPSAENLRFVLTVCDDSNRHVAQDIDVQVSADPGHALYSEFVNQSKDQATGVDKTATQILAKPFMLAPGDSSQTLHMTNADTHGNVSIASVTLTGPLPATTQKTITVDDAAVRPEGAWRIKKDDNFSSYEDNNENKGASLITFPLNVSEAGQYQIALTWRRFQTPTATKNKKTGAKSLRGAPTNGADNVLVEVVSRDHESKLAMPAAPTVPPKGEALFYVDQTLDTIPYADLKTAFQFGPSDGIEVRNEGTHKRVVCDAVRLTPASAADDAAVSPILLKSDDAEGRDKWLKFKGGTFKAYNTVGPDIFQDTDPATGGKRENLALTYMPATAKTGGFDTASFYKVGVIFPGQVDNESRVPVVVHAQASSPIVQVVSPYHAAVGAQVTLDASSSFNLQHSPLKFQWVQTGGPRVMMQDPAAPILKFSAPALTSNQAAWEGLCRALIGHPDFLFSRPRSLTTTTDPKQRRRLQLVKIAQDLLGRCPTTAEIARIDDGAPLSALVDTYLQSTDFRDFYYRRVRLYVESHGTPEQDEPARLWTYIALNDRPFKEILTADYTVGTDWKKESRPDFYGKTGVLTMKGFIQGKQGLPHFNYSAQVCEKFLGYVFEVPDEIVQMRDGITAAATTDPNSVCYTCHKVLTPLAYQRTFWDDDGNFRMHDDTGMAIDATDHELVPSYPFKGAGLEAFAMQAQNKERFVRTILQTHFVWYFGRELRYDTDERGLYKKLWDIAVKSNYSLRPVIKAIVLSPQYLGGLTPATPGKPGTPSKNLRLTDLAQFHVRHVAGWKRASTAMSGGGE